jgi:dsDNA-specific endonuclease/ATPase MutS2
MMNKKQLAKEVINYRFVTSDLFDHLFAYISQLSEIAESLYLELDDLQRQASEFEKQIKKELKKSKQND